MTRHGLEVADVFRDYGLEFMQKRGSSLSVNQRRAFDAIAACRTKVLGGHLEQCNQCGHERNAYNSCGNRNCPKCRARARAEWTEARTAELLPIPFFHVVFTLPKEFGPIALQNQRVVYNILFRAAAQTLKELAADPKHMGAEIGILAVLHTWGGKLDYHVHLHCIVTGGGLSPDGTRWVRCKRSKKNRKDFFIHGNVLSRKFRGKFIDQLKRAFRDGDLGFHGDIASLANAVAFENRVTKAVRNDWVVDVSSPIGSPIRVLKYLARYTNRVAISNDRLIAVRNGRVHFGWKDYRDGGQQKVTSLEPTEFIRRFLLHVVPSGFMKIRYYGFMANRYRREKLALSRKLLGVSIEQFEDDETEGGERESSDGQCESRCPACRRGIMVAVRLIPPAPVQISSAFLSSIRAPPMSRTA